MLVVEGQNVKSGIISNSKPNTSRLGFVSFLMWNPGIRSCLFWVAQVCSRKCCAAMCPWGPWVSVLLPWHLAMAISGKRCFAFWRRPFCRFFFGSLVLQLFVFFSRIWDLREGWNCHIIIFLAEIIYLLNLILNLQDLKAWWKMRVDKVRFFSFQMLTSEVMTFVNHSQVMLLGFKMILIFIILTRRKGRLKDGLLAISDRAFVGWKQSNSL